MTLQTPLTELKGVGPAVAAKLSQLGLKTIADLIDYYPRRYDDFSAVTPINKLKPGAVTVEAVIKQAKGRYVRRGMHITEAVASDDSGSVRLIWFNQPYRARALRVDQPYYISGTFELSHQRLQITNPSVELVSEFPISTARIVPIYRETKGFTSRQLRQILKQVAPMITTLPETLPVWAISSQKLMNRGEAMLAIHFPESGGQLEQARHRLAFEEVFRLSLASLLNKQEIAGEHAPPVPFKETVAKEFVSHVPFTLTNAQRKAVWQIYQDMQKAQPMNRLIEGDVGSGKTVVAAMAALMVLHHGHQVVLMAPTEILARQHADTIQKLLNPLGYGDKVGLLVGSLKPAAKSKAQEAIADGRLSFIIGTHAVIQEKVDLKSLELIIIDEQHRFGVEQRKTLMAKAGHMPHVLSLTATPIPRSLALTLYGELDLSILDEKPPGRKPIQTEICSPNSRSQLYKQLDQELEAGRQLFVVCPLVSESTITPAISAEKMYKTLSNGAFKHRRIGLLHGQMKADAKQAVMQQFVDHELDILIATTVIEVGVDVPNASVMLIENADRFGLSQLHQLRGRIGRGEHASFCYLMMSDSSAPTRRLRAMEQSNDGFKLAELDLELRGPGAIYGTMQHGALDLRIAKLTDTILISQARKAATEFIDKGEKLLDYTELNDHVTRLRAVTNLN
jgi:ATP-dependent DNA helicase RecG